MSQRVVKSIEELVANMTGFAQAGEDIKDFLESVGEGNDKKGVDLLLNDWNGLLRRGKNFVAGIRPDGAYMFVPSRFVGYWDNDLVKHHSNVNRNGGQTDRAISTVLATTPREDAAMEAQFLHFCDTLGISPKDQQRKYWPPVGLSRLGSVNMDEIEQEEAEQGAFDPRDERDSRRRVLASIVRRRGQPQFRKKLLSLYAGRCAITGCTAEAALEAAHIMPYKGERTNVPSNGLLLRADVHTLFDLGLITIDSNWRVMVAEELGATEYADLDGQEIQLPSRSRPNRKALTAHRERALDRATYQR